MRQLNPSLPLNYHTFELSCEDLPHGICLRVILVKMFYRSSSLYKVIVTQSQISLMFYISKHSFAKNEIDLNW